MKRKHDTIQAWVKTECTLWSLILDVFLCQDVANLVFEYFAAFEVRPSHLNVYPVLDHNFLIPIKSGWVFSVMKEEHRSLQTTFNNFQTDFSDLAFQFSDHTLDNDIIVLLREKKEGQFNVETWNVFDQLLMGNFDLDCSLIYECNMIHLPMLQKILSWSWDDQIKGIFLSLTDYWNQAFESIHFSEDVYFLDVVMQSTQQLASFLFKTNKINSFLKIKNKKKRVLFFDCPGFYWLDYPNCVLRQADKYEKDEKYHRFYHLCYGNNFSFQNHKISNSALTFEVQFLRILNLHGWHNRSEEDQTLLAHFLVDIKKLLQLVSSDLAIFPLQLYGGTQRDFIVIRESCNYSYASYPKFVYLFAPKSNKYISSFLS